MRSTTARSMALAALSLLVAMGLPLSASAAVDAGQVRLTRIVGGFASPIGVTNAGDGTKRLFVVEQGGLVRVVKGSAISPTVFLDLTAKILPGGERGLLGLAFDPSFETNRHVFAFYTRSGDGAIVVSRFIANSAGTQAASSSERILTTIAHPTYGNHNGGGLAFGPDGFLYISTGDGGGTGDPFGNARDLDSLLGKILRIDPKGTGAGPRGTYSIPPGNPYVGKAGADEIWASGLRNPWRISFDRVNGALWIGDVGQGRYEEIDRQRRGAPGGRDYGWPVVEGNRCYEATTCDKTGLTAPVITYGHDFGCSVTGGFTYRGASYPDLAGQYVFTDFCSGRLWTMPETIGAVTSHGRTGLDVTSFGEAESGELYAVSRTGALYRVIAP